MLYNIRINTVWTGERIIPAVSSCYLRRIKAIYLSYKIDTELIKKRIKLKYLIPPHSILYLTGGLIECNIVKEKEFIAKNDIVLNVLSKYNLFIKAHPRFDYYHSKEKVIQKLPTYIPANVLMPFFDIVIGYSTSVLFEASNVGCISLSLLDYFEPINTERKENYKKYLNENLINGNIIHYPKSINEIYEIINDLLVQRVKKSQLEKIINTVS